MIVVDEIKIDDMEAKKDFYHWLKLWNCLKTQKEY